MTSSNLITGDKELYALKGFNGEFCSWASGRRGWLDDWVASGWKPSRWWLEGENRDGNLMSGGISWFPGQVVRARGSSRPGLSLQFETRNEGGCSL